MKARKTQKNSYLNPIEFMFAKESTGRAPRTPRASQPRENADRKAIRDLFGLSRDDMEAIETLYDTVNYEQIYKDLDNDVLRKITPVYGDRIISHLEIDKVWSIKRERELKIAYLPSGVFDYKVAVGHGYFINFPDMNDVHFYSPEDEGSEAWVDKYYYESY